MKHVPFVIISTMKLEGMYRLVTLKIHLLRIFKKVFSANQKTDGKFGIFRDKYQSI